MLDIYKCWNTQVFNILKCNIVADISRQRDVSDGYRSLVGKILPSTEIFICLNAATAQNVEHLKVTLVNVRHEYQTFRNVQH